MYWEHSGPPLWPVSPSLQWQTVAPSQRTWGGWWPLQTLPRYAGLKPADFCEYFEFGSDTLFSCSCLQSFLHEKFEYFFNFLFSFCLSLPFLAFLLSLSNPPAECQCYGRAASCHFDPQVAVETGGSGGVCDDCGGNTTGRMCHQCMVGFYRNTSANLSDPEMCIGKLTTNPIFQDFI